MTTMAQASDNDAEHEELMSTRGNRAVRTNKEKDRRCKKILVACLLVLVLIGVVAIVITAEVEHQ